MKPAPFPRERRHTLYFLEENRAFAPVFLDTEVDMGQVRRHRSDAAADGRRYSVVSYVLRAAAPVMAAHPQANGAIGGGLFPRTVTSGTASAKLVMDRRLGGRRVVLAAVLPDLGRADLDGIQRQVDHYRDGDPQVMPEFDGLRKLHRLPVPLGRALFRRATRPLAKRVTRTGTFAVSSLGHGAVDGFHSVGGTTVTLGVGRILDRPVVRNGEVTVAPVMRLNLAFDHRVVDGAEAADILGEIKDRLENFPGETGGRAEDSSGQARDRLETPLGEGR
ncbi:2-oxo acid dehydrogenase subunit E2 [Streptomyces monomycini]|uniref:2-oxo acid dehydrogenase subunit E2 n=1 Tax=Streptomyces monomycini TaxID=371720 RepID=UPI00067E0085|nr:2-oxo acid dehydrogenase subunit E2 [Streptomyces monomycini]